MPNFIDLKIGSFEDEIKRLTRQRDNLAELLENILQKCEAQFIFQLDTQRARKILKENSRRVKL